MQPVQSRAGFFALCLREAGIRLYHAHSNTAEALILVVFKQHFVNYNALSQEYQQTLEKILNYSHKN